MKRKINVALSIVWIILVYGLFLFMRSQLKFPTLDLNNYGWLVPVFMIVSFWGGVLALVSTEKRTKLRVFTSVLLIVGIVVSFCIPWQQLFSLTLWSPVYIRFIPKQPTPTIILFLTVSLKEIMRLSRS